MCKVKLDTDPAIAVQITLQALARTAGKSNYRGLWSSIISSIWDLQEEIKQTRPSSELPKPSCLHLCTAPTLEPSPLHGSRWIQGRTKVVLMSWHENSIKSKLHVSSLLSGLYKQDSNQRANLRLPIGIYPNISSAIKARMNKRTWEISTVHYFKLPKPIWPYLLLWVVLWPIICMLEY